MATGTEQEEPLKEKKTSTSAGSRLPELKADGNNNTTTCEHLALSRQHSPLSYHESLMQRQHPHAPPVKNVVQHHSIDNVNLSKLLLAAEGAAAGGGQRRALGGNPRGGAAPCAHQQACRMLGAGPPPLTSSSQKLLNHHYHAHHQHHAHHAHQPAAHQNSRRSNAASSKKSVVRMLVAVVVSFFICWVPFHAQRLLASYLVKDENQNQLLLDIYLKLTYISGVMYYLSSTINPLLYQLMSAKFRLAFKETFKCSLLKCAFFARRSSTATNATVCLAGHSPTNSIRDHYAHQSLCSTPLPPPPQLGQNSGQPQQPGECSCCCNPGGGGGGGGGSSNSTCSSCCCCGNCGQLRFVQPLPAASALARLRGRLNSSLTSLLKPQHPGHLNHRAAGAKLNASCSCLAHRQNSDGQLGVGEGVGVGGAAVGAGTRERRKLLGGKEQNNESSLPSRCGTPSATSAAFCNQQRLVPTIQTTAQQLTASTPLLGEHAHDDEGVGVGVARQNGDSAAAAAAASSKRRKPEAGLAASQANFPVHHTMLKFIRSSTPSSCSNLDGQQPVPSLTRLSSREDEDEDELTAGADQSSSREGELDNRSLSSRRMAREIAEDDEELLAQSSPLLAARQDPLMRHKMVALIRPSQQKARATMVKPSDEEEDANESDELIVATSTESSGQSSAGTSPDQVGGGGGDGGADESSPNSAATNATVTTAATTVTTTTTAATTTSSSPSSTSSSFSGPANRQHRAHLLGMQAEFCSGPAARQPLGVSKSTQTRAGQPRHSCRHRAMPVETGHRKQPTRRRSLQQGAIYYANPQQETSNSSSAQADGPTVVQRNESVSSAATRLASLSEAERQRQLRKSLASQATNGNTNYLSSSVSSSEVRLDLLASKRMSLSTTTTSVLDDNSSLLTNNSQLTNSNPNLRKVPKCQLHGNNNNNNSNNNNNNNNNTSNDDDHEIEDDPSTVINMENDLLLTNCNTEMANLIV